jgi:glycosyltransferase involved in cell wall biosynthesis
VQRLIAEASLRSGAKPRAHSRLRHLSRRRWRACHLAGLRGKPLQDRYAPWHRYTLAAEAEMFRHPALRAVICNSRMVRDDIARRFGVTDDKLHVIYNGVDLESFPSALRREQGEALRAKTGVERAGATAR